MRTVRDMSKNDEIWTPPEAVDPIIKHLTAGELGWEMCPGSGMLVDYLRTKGVRVSHGVDKDGLTWELPLVWDFIITNPPWSKKHLFLQRCVELDKPFALLLPVRTLGVRRCQIWLEEVDVLFLAKRVDFTGGGSPYEACAWFTHDLLHKRMVFE